MANKINIVIQATNNASRPVKEAGDSIDRLGQQTATSSRAMGALGSVGSTAFRALKVASAAAVATVTAGLTAAATAAFDQVKGVEEARFGLQAYEKDAGKVNAVLKGLVAYAQSDMGVLFNRRDMFDAASTLKMYGNETGTLTERVKILSKGVAQGKTTFQELSAIVGRAAAKGRLDAVDFDMLIERGIGLSREFRGAEVSADDLWKALNNALPDQLLAGRASTIEGRFTRLQTAFRNVGNAVLGVDKQTNEFIKGGLGDRFMTAVTQATEGLKDLAPAAAVVGTILVGLMDGFGAVSGLLGAIGTAVADAFQRLISDLQPSIEWFLTYVWPSLQLLAAWVGQQFKQAWDQLSASLAAVNQVLADAGLNINVLSVVLGALAAPIVAVGALLLALIATLTFLALGVAKVIQFLSWLNQQFISAARAAGSWAASLRNDTANTVNAIAGFFGGLPGRIGAAIAGLWGAAAGAFNSFKSNAVGWAHNTVNDIVGGFSSLPQRIGDKIRGAISGAASAASGLLSNLKIPGFATGTTYAPGGMALVGENGPELVNLPRGSKVFPNYQSRGMGGGGDTIISINGPIQIANPAAADAFWNNIDKTQRLAKVRMA